MSSHRLILACTVSIKFTGDLAEPMCLKTLQFE